MSRVARPLDVAIIGMACRFPGARDLAAYWDNILNARESIRDVPSSRWNASIFYDSQFISPGRVTGQRGGYLDEPIEFDPAAHGIMPRTVEGGEPEQFLVLDTTRAALIDANLPDGINDGRRVDVVIGRGNYFNRGNLTRLQHGRVLEQTLAILRTLHPDWTQADLDAIRNDLRNSLPPFEAGTIAGQLTNATAGRVADRFNLAGASFVVDAASASALLALDLGARSLVSRRSDLAIVGSVYIQVDVDFPMVFSQLGSLSRSGKSRPFTDEADGMVPGEGVGVVVLKRLKDAERDGDRVYAVVKGVGLASDGRGAGLATPDAKGHLRSIRRAYRTSGVDPADVGLIEGHGLGVPAADRAELRAIRAGFPPMSNGTPRILGAVSALIGHAMPAAGMAGLIKSALALHHRVLPASTGADRPSRELSREDGSTTLNPKTRPWIHGSPAPRLVGVNGFGFAGINAHAILQEHPESADGVVSGAMLQWPTEAILIGADDRASLVERANHLAFALRDRRNVVLKDLAATLASEATTRPSRVRLGLVVATVDELISRLESLAPKLSEPTCRTIRDTRGSYFWSEPLGTNAGVACLFPGEGSQYPGMLADLCPHFPEIRARFDTAERLARSSGSSMRVSEHLFGDTGGDPSQWLSGEAVNVVLSSQWAIYGLLRTIGLQPQAVAGHSSGEFLALAASGYFEVDRGLEEQLGQLAAIFTRLESEGSIPSARLVSLATNRVNVEAAIRAGSDTVVVAVDNCPHQVVIAGPEADVEAVVQSLRDRGVAGENLPFSRAYHTAAFESVIDPLQEFFQSLPFANPSIPLYSCCSGARVSGEPEEMRRLAVAQWSHPVEFRKTIDAMHKDGLRIFVDVGARGNLAGFVEDTLRGRPSFAVAANLPRRSGLTQLNHLVASLYAQGLNLNASYLFARRRPLHVDLEGIPSSERISPSLDVGFPEMTLSADLIKTLRHRMGGQSPISGSPPVPPASTRADDDAAMLAYVHIMDEFLKVQQSVMALSLDSGILPVLDNELASRKVAATDCFTLGVKDQLRFTVGERNGSLPRSVDQEENPLEFHRNRRLLTRVDLPWDGHILNVIEGRESVVTFSLDPVGDPVAENHTFGGRRVSRVDPSLKGLPVLPFTVMGEMLVQSASILVPGSTLVAIENLQARRWIRYEDRPIRLQVRVEAVADRPGAFHARLFNLGVDGTKPDEKPDVEGFVIFGEARPEPAVPAEFIVANPETCRFTSRSMYEEQWLFHGPLLRAVSDVGAISDIAFEGRLRVLPRAAIFRDGMAAKLFTDPIVLDAFTHLLGCWGLDRLPEGDVIFPLRMGRLEIFGDDPAEGAECPCRISIREVDRHRVRVDAEILRPDGRVWMRICDWEDWRFYWPSRYRDFFRQPERTLLGEPIKLPGESGAVAVWLQAPIDMSRGVWRDTLEQTQLSPEERRGCLRPEGHDDRRTLRLWGRIAAKDAVRRLWLEDDCAPVYPADISIEPDGHGRPLVRSRIKPDWTSTPSVSIAHTEGAAIALAARNPHARVGIDVERIVSRSEAFEAIAFSVGERALLDCLAKDARDEWCARLWCAKESAAKATGLALVAGPSSVDVIEVDQETGQMLVKLGPDLANSCPELAKVPVLVSTHRREDFAWGWTVLDEGAEYAQ
jgi:acyl transferase domain-containing protein/4'-phosphopantetheinyl transferase EntD